MNGKGDSPRPLSVDANTFANNWDRIFGIKSKTTDIDPDYQALIQSGMFWERYPNLTGNWEQDKINWALQRLTENAEELGLYDTSK
jgi:hypothetical protein